MIRNVIQNLKNSPCAQCISRAVCQSAPNTVDSYYKFYMFLSEKCKLFKDYTNYIDRIREHFDYEFASAEHIVKLSFPKVKYKR